LEAQYLFHHKKIKKLPDWVLVTEMDDEAKATTCPSCGQEQGGGFKCSNCGYILDPVLAYEAEEIEEENPALRRLSREQLDSMDLEHVQTSEEYRASKRGGRQPKSEEKEHDAKPAGRRRGQQAEEPKAEEPKKD